MTASLHPDRQLHLLTQLRSIAKKMATRDDDKYRTLYLNNPKLQHNILAVDGCLEFLYNLGFAPDAESPLKIVCQQPDHRVLEACIASLTDRINLVSAISMSVQDAETKHQRLARPSSPAPPIPKLKSTKTFVFIRTANSVWHRFAESGRKKKWAALAVGISEYLRAKNNPSNHSDTWVVDAPISRKGVDQAYGLANFLHRHYAQRLVQSLSQHAAHENDEKQDAQMPLDTLWVLDQLTMNCEQSIVVTSNLRRAISTAIISLWDRLATNSERIHILPCLQELSRGIMNVDAWTPINEKQIPTLSNAERSWKKLNVEKMEDMYQKRLFLESTNESIGSMTEQQRFQCFCDWAFAKTQNTVIICGHALWFKAFFKAFLSEKSKSMFVKNEMQHCGVVAFRMHCQSASVGKNTKYEIIDTSIAPVYMGFA